ncbi:hypothetical protein M0M57_01190 [Flavobacterium azooxidireducens]|uniref:DUF2793 domain-containing protein n=1 Tax=Flavobacterium azooxidireducens TaxID=1871076 RepID=A0ABY4KGP1_9FLAO|nr:hypothetical protein [Flavobacterium azooxidireducens]UPQ79466.1 hypothetical protein M0M57_01190 [Flavobacterium azooxidireducens]
MKKILTLLLLLPFLAVAQVGVNTTTPKAALDVESTNNGVLIPRVQLTSILDNTTITNPNLGPLETSTLVYNIAAAGTAPNNVVAGFYYWNNTTSRWIAIAASAGWELDGNATITTPANPVTYGTSLIGATENFVGTTDNNDFTIGTNNIERMRVKSTTGNVGIGIATPTEKLHVFQNSDANKSTIFGVASQLSTVADFQNIGVKGYANGVSNYGFANGVMGIADRTNSYYATGVYGHLGTTTPSLPFTNQAIFANGNGEASVGTIHGLFAQATGTNATGGTRIGGYFTASGALNNYGIIVPNGGGNVGIGTITPNLARLQVDGLVGNTSAIFRGSATSQGISMVADWPGVYFNSYYNGAIRSMAGTGFTSIINTDQSVGGLVFQTTSVANPASGTAIASVPVRMTIAGNGNVGIGAPTPSNLLHVNSATSGAVRIVDGTQANGRVLTSNATGVATWQPIGINNIVGYISPSGTTINYTTAQYLQTGSYITLPPGRFAVNVNMLMARSSLSRSFDNSFFWVRSSFSDSAGINPMPSPDIVGSDLISGNHPGSSYYSMLSGAVIINNATGANKTYYYIAGNVVTYNTNQNITGFGSTYWAEDNIIAYRLN